MSERFHKLVDLMAALRAPNGCPWDRKIQAEGNRLPIHLGVPGLRNNFV